MKFLNRQLILQPHNVFDLAIGYVSESYKQYHVLPQELSVGVSYVLDTIADAAKRFKIQHGVTPVLVLDGIDLVR